MALSAEEIAEIERLLAPGSGIGDEERTALLEARNAYQDEHLARSTPAAAAGGDPGLEMNPSFSLIPQALALQPATTHPGGDEAAEAEWRRDPAEASKGKVFVYDVPLAQAKKDLLEHPEKIRALYPELLKENPGAITPETIMAMEHGDELYEDYQQQTWRDTANAAAAAGKTAIRTSKAPWFSAGAGSPDVLGQLALKLEGAVQPYGEGSAAFIMGVDDMAAFGAGAAAAEASGAPMQTGNPFGSERYGGVTTTDPVERNAQLREEYPALHFGGQALGALSGWGPANYLFQQIGRLGKAGASALGGGIAARAGAGAAAGTAAAGAQRGISDLVDVGARELNPDVGAPALGDIPGRMGETAALAAPLAAGGALLGEAASAKAGLPAERGKPPAPPRPGDESSIRWGNRYDGAVGQLERDVPDFEVRTLGGPRSKGIEQAKVAARKADQQPGDMMAREIAPAVARVLDQDVKGVIDRVSKTRDEFLASPEGRQPLPVRNFLAEAVKELRADMQAAGKQGVPRPVGRADSAGELKNLFNTQVDSVSLSPVEGAIALSPEEAQAFLGTTYQRQLLKAKPVTAPTGGPRQPFERASDAGPPIEALRTVPVRGEPSPPPLVERPTTPGAGQFRAPEGVLGEPLPARPPSPGPGQPPLIEPPAPPSRPSAAINASAPRREAASLSEGQAPEAAPARTGAPAAAPAPTGGPRSAELREKMARGKGVADTLRKRGVGTVYVVPRAYDAEHTETLLDKIAAEQKKGNRDLSRLDKAARLDRDARTLGGEAGGWSKLQNQHSELIEKSKLAEQLGAPGGDSFKVLAGYGKEKTGELLRADVLRDAASRAGVREQLDKIRSLERYEGLRAQTKLERASGDQRTGAFTRAAELSSIRLLPMLDTLSGLGGGLGRGALLGQDDAEKERRKKQLQEGR